MRADADTATTGAAASEASVSSSRPPTPRPPASGRVARNRARRSDEFLRAALAIVVDQGFEALTMARLAQEVDTAIGSVYRYYASKDHLLLAVQTSAVEKLTATFAASVPPVVEAVSERLPEEDRHLVEHYLPAVLGGGRLARQLSLDLLTGWGADPAGLARVDAAVDAVAATGPLVRAPEG